MDDNSLQDLENELKALRPRRPSVLLRARVEHELTTTPTPAPARRYASATTLRSWKWFSWQMAAAAAVALAVSLAVWRGQTRPPAPITPAEQIQLAQENPAAIPTHDTRRSSEPASSRALAARDAYRPVKAANVLYDLQDEGVVTLEDNTPARRVRARYVDTYTWKNPATNASLKWSVPRDEVRVLPASFH